MAEENEIDTSPLRVMASTGTSHILRQPSEHLMRLKPMLVVPILGAAFGLLFVGVGIVFLSQSQSAGWFISGAGAVFAVAFVLVALAMRRVDFDQGKGEMVIRRFGVMRRYPLESIRAIQLIEGGWHGGGAQRPKYFTYQLNLVLNDADSSRINLTNNSNWDATWKIGSELSEFLGVPLMDEVPGE